MLQRRFTQCVLRPADLAPVHEGFQVVGAFNPGVTTLDGQTVLMVRIVEQSTEQRDDALPSPRYHTETGRVEIDWLERDTLALHDPRVYQIKKTGLTRLRFFSYLKILRSRDGITLDDRQGLNLLPENEYEEYGLEDPRITKIDNTYYITYVAVSRHGVATALMSTTDFQRFQRHGIIFPPENKDVLLFPERIAGQYAAIHRPVTSIRFRNPEMWLARSPDLIYWGAHEKMLGVEATFEQSRIGGGTPPIRTERGWLTLYHGSNRRPDDPSPGIYTAGALLIDFQNPHHIIARSPEAVMVPEADFERRGYVPDVVFPTGITEHGDDLYIYYGAADECTGVTACKRDDLLNTLEPISIG